MALEKGTTSIAFNNSFGCSWVFFFFPFRLFVKLHVPACPIKALLGAATCCKFSSLLQHCQLARHSDLSSFFNMFVSRMQMLSSLCLHSVLDSASCV